MLDEIKIIGANELEKYLSTFTEKIERRIVKRALRPGATVISKEAKARVQRRSGTLRKAIAVRNVKKQTAVQVYVRSGRGQKNDGWYAHIIEHGAKPHVIRPYKDRKKVLAAGGKIFGKRVNHPGIKARPFLQPALNAASQTAVNVIGKKMAELIEREVRR